MLHHLEITLLPDPAGGARLVVTGGGGAPALATRDLAELDGLTAAVEAALRPRAGLARAGFDGEQTRREREAGARLGDLLLRDDEPGRRLAAAIAEARGARAPLALILDLRLPALGRLPWELFVDREGLAFEPSGQGLVARRDPSRGGRAQPPTHPDAAIEALFWCPDPEDPTCARLAARLSAARAQHDLPPARDASRAPAEGGILYLICHGRGDAEALDLLAREVTLHPETASHALGPALRGCRLAVLACCDAAAPAERVEGLAGQLLAAGAPLVLASPAPLAVEAAEALIEGLTASLAAGAPLGLAIAAARAAVRALALPQPDGRWSRVQAWVRDPAALDAVICVPGPPLPAALAHAGPDARRLIGAALTLAEARRDGFIGVEHIAAAMASQASAGDATRLTVDPGRAAVLTRHLDAQSHQAGRPCSPPRPTPRIVALAASLPTGFDLHALHRGVHAAWDRGLLELLGLALLGAPMAAPQETTRATELIDPAGPGPTPADGLRLIGGPEDGRELWPQPGAVIGRASALNPPDIALYADSARVDPSLGRAHLRWLGPGRVSLQRAGQRLWPGRGASLAPGEHELRVGDVLLLSAGTVALGIAHDASADRG